MVYNDEKGVWMRRFILILTALALVIGCKKNYVAQVGTIQITEEDLLQRAKVSEIYYPKSGQRYVALAQLIQGYLDEEVLKQLGYKVDDSVWEAESRRIDENTKAPDVLKKIKDAYGLNKSGYIKTFVRVVYAERYLYNEVFLKSPEIHKEKREQAENFIREASAVPESFKSLAEKQSLKVATLLVSEKEGIQPYEDSGKKLEPAGRPPEPGGIEQAKFIISKIKDLKDGQVLPEIIEWQEGFQVLRLVKKDGEVYTIESVSVPKIDYDVWFWGYASKIPVRINDPALKSELLKNVGWASKLKIE